MKKEHDDLERIVTMSSRMAGGGKRYVYPMIFELISYISLLIQKKSLFPRSDFNDLKMHTLLYY